MDAPSSLADALDSLQARTPVASALRSADWAELPLGIRTAAQFSATVENLRVLQRIQYRLEEIVGEERRQLADGSQGAFGNKQNFINEVRQLAIDEGLTPQDARLGTLRDITSQARLALIADMQTGFAQGFAQHKADQDPDLLDADPAQELIRIGARTVPRDWRKRWADAGGKFYGGRMIARKDSPIWMAISRFRTPYPPFDYRSGMGLGDVTRATAEALGVIKQGEVIKPHGDGFTDALQASVKDLSPALQARLKGIFGNQIEIKDGVAAWKGAAA